MNAYKAGWCEGAIDVEKADCVLDRALVERRNNPADLCHVRCMYGVCFWMSREEGNESIVSGERLGQEGLSLGKFL